MPEIYCVAGAGRLASAGGLAGACKECATAYATVAPVSRRANARAATRVVVAQNVIRANQERFCCCTKPPTLSQPNVRNAGLTAPGDGSIALFANELPCQPLPERLVNL